MRHCAICGSQKISDVQAQVGGIKVDYCADHGIEMWGRAVCQKPIGDGLHCADVEGHDGPCRRVLRG